MSTMLFPDAQGCHYGVFFFSALLPREVEVEWVDALSFNVWATLKANLLPPLPECSENLIPPYNLL